MLYYLPERLILVLVFDFTKPEGGLCVERRYEDFQFEMNNYMKYFLHSVLSMESDYRQSSVHQYVHDPNSSPS